ncbi:MAG: peptidoglycan-binding protein [Coprococcus catus]|nr:peptidoglycan-binding protein [Coprococcus catus]MDY5988331.1 peptidoglycan-binding protein [Coprococcus catus]
MSKTFNQADWGKVNGISMAASGCGPSSLASIIFNKDTSTTPVKVAQWLYNKGYFYTSGTTRTGITAALNYYGFESIYYKPEHTGGAIWQEAMAKMKAAKGDWWAIFLVVGTANGGKDNLWTSGGHYLAITDLKNGKLYVRDSGSKKRTGYYDPELLRYDTNVIWVIQKKDNTAVYSGTFPTLPAKGYFKKGDSGQQIKYLQMFMKWYGVYNGKVDGSFGPDTEAAVIAYQKAEVLSKDGWFGPKCLARAKTVKK